MNAHWPKVETWLELGFGLFALALIAALLTALAGRTATGMRSRAKRVQPPPQRGLVAPSNHTNVRAVATR